jgi:hypothetical protein
MPMITELSHGEQLERTLAPDDAQPDVWASTPDLPRNELADDDDDDLYGDDDAIELDDDDLLVDDDDDIDDDEFDADLDV